VREASLEVLRQCCKPWASKAQNVEYQYERLYRNLYNPEFYLLAYKNIASSQGSMTLRRLKKHIKTQREMVRLLLKGLYQLKFKAELVLSSA